MEVSPFVAASSGAMRHLEQNPLLQRALKEGVNKDIWGSTWAGFMGIEGEGYGGPSGEIPDNTQGRTQAFVADVSVYRCVDIRGAAIASVPLKIYDSPDIAKRREVEHEAMDVLITSNPFHWVAGPNLMRYSLGSRDLHGSFAWRLVNDRGGRQRAPLPREVYWMPPGQYSPVSGKDMKPPQPKVPFGGLKVRPGDGSPEFFLPAEEVVYAPTYNPTDPLRGTSRISALRTDLNLRLYGQASNMWFFRNNQRPDVVVTGAFSPTVENVGLMRRIWKAAFGGDGNRGPAFLPSDMRVNLLTMSQKDAEWLGQRQAAREDILAAFGVPPPVYGDLARATYENIRTAYEGFWRSGMIPELDEMAWVLTTQFLWKWPDARQRKFVFAYDYAAIEALQEDANAIWERTMQMVDRLNTSVERRALLPNQMRAIAQQLFKAAGLPDKPWNGKVPGGEMFYVRLQEIPLLEASVQANVDAQAARAGITNGETNKPGNGHWVLPDATQVTGDPTVAPPAAIPAPAAPREMLPPAQPTKVLIHNHLTRLEWPQLPAFPGESAEEQFARDQGRPADDHPGEHLLTGASSSIEQPKQAACDHEQPGYLQQATQPAQIHALHSALHAHAWLTRRLKRHFQDQQTVALRTLRAALDGGEQGLGVDALLDWEAGLRSLEDVIQAALAMVNQEGGAYQAAERVEQATAELLNQALLASAEDGEGPRAAQDRVREVFRHSIEERAEAVALALIGGLSATQETAA